MEGLGHSMKELSLSCYSIQLNLNNEALSKIQPFSVCENNKGTIYYHELVFAFSH